MKTKNSKIIKWSLLVIISTTLLLFITNSKEEFRFILNIKYEYLAAIVFLYLLSSFFLSYRYYLSIKSITDNVDILTCYKYFIVGRFINSIIPQGGGVYRALSFKKRDQISYKKYLASFFFFMWIDFTFSLFFGAIIIGFYNPYLSINNINILHVFIILFTAFLLLIPLLTTVHKLLKSFNLNNKFKRVLEQTSQAFELSLSFIKIKLLFQSIIIIVLNLLIGLMVVFLSFKSININTNIAYLAVFLILTRFSNILQITPGNFGVREFIFGFLSESMGIGIAEGIAASMILRLAIVVEGLQSLFFVMIDKFEINKKHEISLERKN